MHGSEGGIEKPADRQGAPFLPYLEVVFQDEAEAGRVFAATHHPPCFYSHPSFSEEPPVFTDDDWLELVMESRRLACDRRYRERRRQLNLLLRTAA
jgi:hypothetical protein